MDYIRAGYVGDRGLCNVNEEDLSILTHINIAFGHVVNNKLKVEDTTKLEDIKRIRSMNPNVKILLSVGGWSSGGFSTAASTAEGRKAFAETSLEAIENYDLDGIDIDWEYPCINWAGIDTSPDDKYNFSLYLQEIRDKIGKDKMLTIAAGAGKYFPDVSADLYELREILDYVSLMTYDLAGFLGGYTAHHTNLYTPDTTNTHVRWSGAACAEYFHENGLPYNKMVFGAAFYSRRFDGVEPKNNGLFQKSASPGGYGPGYETLVQEYINKNGWTRYWDDSAKAPYLFNGSSFITYDDEESITEKCRYIKEKGILGLMYWEHSSDPMRRLVKTIGRELR